MSQSVRKAVSVLITILLIFAIFLSCSAAPISETFTYDANGNMISGSGLCFVYNDANQLVKIINESGSSTVAEYFYDSDGQRVKKIEDGTTTYYIGDYVETRVTGSTADNTSYYFANNERVARKDPDGAMYYYHGDHLGSTSIVTDETGAQSEKVSYYPYGSVKERVGEGSTYLFTDHEFDDESGLYYYGARYYDPDLPRFTQPDTIIPDTYNPQSLNRYAYVLNNPLKYTDPEGYFWVEFGLPGGVAYLVGSAAGVAEYCIEHKTLDFFYSRDAQKLSMQRGSQAVVWTWEQVTKTLYLPWYLKVPGVTYSDPIIKALERDTTSGYIPQQHKEKFEETSTGGGSTGGGSTGGSSKIMEDSSISVGTRETAGSHANLLVGSVRHREYHLYPATGLYQVQVSPESISYACIRCSNKTMPRFFNGGI